MEVKTIEIRDSGTFIPALAIKLAPGCEADRYLLARAGFGETEIEQQGYVLLVQILGGGGHVNCDPYEFGDRTHHVVLRWLIDHFPEVRSGDVVDVQFLLGETDAPKRSERETVGG